jgi:hypothetical protein
MNLNAKLIMTAAIIAGVLFIGLISYNQVLSWSFRCTTNEKPF